MHTIVSIWLSIKCDFPCKQRRRLDKHNWLPFWMEYITCEQWHLLSENRTEKTERRKREKCKFRHSHDIVWIKWNIYRQPSLAHGQPTQSWFRSSAEWQIGPLLVTIDICMSDAIIDNSTHRTQCDGRNNSAYFVCILKQQKSLNSIPIACRAHTLKKDGKRTPHRIRNTDYTEYVVKIYIIITNNYLLKSNKHSICDAKEFSIHLIMMIMITVTSIHSK